MKCFLIRKSLSKSIDSANTTMDLDDESDGALTFSLYSAPSMTSRSSVQGQNKGIVTHQPSHDEEDMILSNQFTRVGSNINPSILQDDEEVEEETGEKDEEDYFPATQLDDHIMTAVRSHQEREEQEARGSKKFGARGGDDTITQWRIF